MYGVSSGRFTFPYFVVHDSTTMRHHLQEEFACKIYTFQLCSSVSMPNAKMQHTNILSILVPAVVYSITFSIALILLFH